MDGDTGSSNPCCLKLKDRYSKLKERLTKLEEGRNALRQGISIYEQQLSKMQTENLDLKKAYQEERARADSEKENTDKESALRITLETEISTLKSEILSLSQRGGQLAEDTSQELDFLRSRALECDTNINRLKLQLEKERIQADVEKAKEKKKVQAERSKVNDLKKVVEMERKRTEELQLQIDNEKQNKDKESALRVTLEAEISALKSDILSLKQRGGQVAEDVSQELDVLRSRASECDTEINQLKELLKVEKAKTQKEKEKADESAKTVQAERSKVNDLKKAAEMERKRIEELQLQIDNEKQNKDKESALRVTLEAEISALKSDILSLKQHGGQVAEDVSQELDVLRSRASEYGTEINQLKELLKVEKAKTQKEKEKADESAKTVQAERSKVNDLKKAAEMERKRIEELQLQIDNEKQNKDKESALRVTLEAEISALKSDILSLKQRGGQVAEDVSQELDVLRSRASECDTEINQLKELLKVEKVKTRKGKEKADELAKTVQAERSKVNDLKKVAEMERKRIEELQLQIDNEKQNKDKESALRVTLEAEISALKSDILSLKQRGGQVAEDVSRCSVSEYDKEINRLKELLKKERALADVEKTKAQEEKKKKADELAKKVQAERSKVNDHKKVADMERKRVQELLLQVESLQSDAEEAKSKLSLETKKLKVANNMLCAEKERSVAERKCSELQMAKVEEQRKVAESNLKLGMAEKSRANNMSEQLDKTTQRLKELEKEMVDISSGRIKQAGKELIGEISSEALEKEINEKETCKRLEKVTQQLMKVKKRAKSGKKKVEEQRQLAENFKKAAIEGKLHADQLAYELQHYKQKVEDTEMEIQRLRLPKALLESFTHPSSGSLLVETAEMKILRMQLKLEKMRLKQAKQIAKVEIGRNQLLLQETLHLKQELLKFAERLDTLDSCLLHNYGGIDEREKLGKLKLQRDHLGVEASSGTSVLEVEPSVSGLSGRTRKGNNDKLALRTENIVGGPVLLTASKTRKRPHEMLEPVENLDSAGHNLQQQVFGKLTYPRGMLNHQTDIIPFENNRLIAHGESTLTMDQSKRYKKMKSSSGNTPASVNLYDNDELKTMPDNLGLKQPNVCVSAPSAVGNLTTLTQVGNEVLDEDLSRSQHLPGDFDEFFCGNFLKLVDLDNEADEERYRKAIQRPLSPTLPQIEFKNSETPEICYEGNSNIKEVLTSYCSFDVINLEIDANTRDSSLMVTKFSNVTSENVYEKDNNDQKVNEKDNNDPCNDYPLKICNVTGFTVPEQNPIVHAGNEVNPVCGVFLKHCVVFSENTENCSIFKVYLATRDCLTELLGSTSTFLQNVLPSVWKAGDLSSKERVCVFFSLLLHYISDVTKANLGEKLDVELVLLLKSFAQQICSVLSDASSRRWLMQIDVQEMFVLMEDFLLNGRVVMNDFLNKESTVGCLSMANIATDSCLNLSVQEASTTLLIAGGVVLASVCAATDHIGFLCEVSVNVFRIQLLRPWVIKLLHIFAYICGSRYFELEDHSLEISVLKCLVVLSENVNSPYHSTTCIPSIFRDSSKYSPCANCPFMDGVVSVDDIAVLLLEKLQGCASFSAEHSHSRKTSHMSNDGRLPIGARNEASSDTVNAHSSSFCSDEYLLQCIDLVSLLELVACLKSWEWTHSNIVAPLVQILESSVMEHLSASLITLLGQLGRLGIDAKGCEDPGVENLRDWLCNCLSQSYSSNFGLHYQFAAATSLTRLIGSPFEEILERDSEPPAVAISQSAASKCIKKWFSSLSAEQMSSFRLLQSSASTK